MIGPRASNGSPFNDFNLTGAGSWSLSDPLTANGNVTQTAGGALGFQAFSAQVNKLSKYFDVSFLTDATKAFKIALNYDNIELFRLAEK